MRILGNRETQDIEIRSNFEPYADIECKECLGTAKGGWVRLEQRYRICNCVLKNIKKMSKQLVN